MTTAFSIEGTHLKTTNGLGNKDGQSSLKAVWTLAIAVLSLLFAAADVYGQAGPYSFFPLTPCRVVDTRNANGPSGGPALAANTDRSFPVINVNSCGVPSTAKAAVFNVTAVAPGDNGNFIIYPAGSPRPNTSVVNWSVADFATGNGAFLPLANQGGVDITVYPNMPPGSPGTVHLVIDVTGYFQ
jgi:hypothetical protein